MHKPPYASLSLSLSFCAPPTPPLQAMSLEHARSLPDVVRGWTLPSQAQGRIDMVRLATKQYREFWTPTNTILNVSPSNLRFEGGRELTLWRQHLDDSFLAPGQMMWRSNYHGDSHLDELLASYCMIKAFAQYVGSQSGDLATRAVTIADLQRKFARAYSQATRRARTAQVGNKACHRGHTHYAGGLDSAFGHYRCFVFGFLVTELCLAISLCPPCMLGWLVWACAGHALRCPSW